MMNRKLNEIATLTVRAKPGCNRTAASRLQVSRRLLALASASVVGWTASVHAANTVYQWTGDNSGSGTVAAPYSGNFSDPLSWTNAGVTGVPISAATTELDFNASGSNLYTANYDSAFNSGGGVVTGPFTLNEIQLFSTSTAVETISASVPTDTLSFTSNGTATPQLLLNGTGGFNINAGMVLTNNTLVGGTGTGVLNLNGNISGAGNLTLALPAGVINLSGNNTYTGTTTINGGTVNYTGSGSTTGDGILDVGNAAGTTTVLNLNSPGAYNFNNGATVSDNATSSAAINLNAGTLNLENPSGSYVGLGNGGYASLVMSGIATGLNVGTSSNSTGLRVGTGSATAIGIFTQTAGTVVLQRYLAIGNNGVGVATLTGGTMTVLQTRSLVGDNGAATSVLNLGTEAGGNNVFSTTLGLNVQDTTLTTGSSTTNLDSGTLILGTTGIYASSTATLNLNGALIEDNSTNTALISNAAGLSANVFNGGANFSIGAGATDTVTANLLATTGNGINPAGGIFAVANGSGGTGYIGAPRVTVFGAGTGATAIANVSNGTITGIILTNPGQGYTAGSNVTFNFSGGGATVPVANYTTALNSSNLVPNGTGGLTMSGAGTLILTGANTYTGPTVVNGGILSLGSTGALGSTSAITLNGGELSLGIAGAINTSGPAITFAGGSLQFTAANTTDYSSKFSTAAAQAYSIDTNGQNVSFATPLTSVGGSLTKLGAGSLTLTAPATFSGATTINAGKLILAPGSGLASNAVTVSSGTTLNTQTGASGTIALGTGSTNLTVAGGGTLDMTDGYTGQLNINSGAGTGLTLGSATGTAPANLVFEVGAGSSDSIAVTGGVSVLSSGALINVESLGITPGNYTLISAANGLGTAGFSLYAPVISANGLFDLSLSHSTATQEILTVTADTSASSLYWSGQISNNWNTNASGGNTNWQTDATSGINAMSVPGAGTNVFFTANSGTASNLATTLGANTFINSLTFSGNATGAISIAAGNTLTIYATGAGGNTAGNGITMNANPAIAPVTINAGVGLGGNQTWTNNDPVNALTIGGSISGPYSLTQAGVGTLTLNGSNTFTGGLNTTGGSLNLGNAAALGTGTFTISGPTVLDNTTGAALTLSTNNAQVWGGSGFTFNGSNNLNLGTGTKTLANSLTLTLNAKTLGVGGTITDGGNGYVLTTAGAGNLNVTGAIAGTTSLVLNGTGLVAVTGAQTYSGSTTVNSGTLTYNGSGSNLGTAASAGLAINNGQVNYNSSATSSFNNNGNPFILGATSTSAGALYQSAGTLNMITATSGNGYLQLGNNGGYGYIGLSGGTLNSGSATVSSGFRVGSGATSYGVLLQTGGTLVSHRYYVNGSGGDAVSTFTGGTASLGTDGFAVYLSESNSGSTMNIGTEAGGTATVIAASTVATNGGIRLDSGSGNVGYLNLNSGNLTIDSAGIYTGASSNTSVVNLNGGTLMPGATGIDLIPAGNSSLLPAGNFAVSNVNVYNGGAVINTNGSNTTISSSLTGATGNGIYKNTAFTATPTGAAGAGYIGAPVVTVTGGDGTGALAIANVDTNPADAAYGQITGFTLTNPGQNYNAGNTLTFTLSGGVESTGTAAAPYTYTLASTDVAANNGGLTKLGAGTLFLSGVNTYTGRTNISAGTLQITGAGTIGTGPVTVASSAVLSFNNSAGLTIPGIISGAGSIVQLSSAGTTLTAAETYTGTTNISAGKLVLAPSSSLANTAITVASGATLNAQTGAGTMTVGTSSASLTLLPGSTFDMTDGAIGTFKLNGSTGTGLTIGAATGAPAVLTFEVGNNGADQIVATGNASVAASGAKINLIPLASATSLNTSATYPLITAAALSSSNGSNFSLANTAININGQLYDETLINTATTESVSFVLDTTSAGALYWSGAQNGVWNTLNGSGSNWQTAASGGTDPVKIPSANTNVYFSINGGGSNQTATNLGANTSINTLTFTNTGSSTPIGINGYTLTINNNLTAGGSPTSGITANSGAPAVTINSNIALGGSLAFSSNSSNPLVVAGVIGGPAGSVLTIGPGTGAVTLTGSNTFAGGMNAVGGTLNINNPAALGTGTFTVNGPVTIDNTTGTAETLTVAQQQWNSNFTFNGSADLNTGTGNVSIGAPTTVTLNAHNLTLAGNVTDNGIGYTLTTAGAGNLNLTGSVSGSTSLTATGPGAMNISGNNTYTGATNAYGGTINFIGAANSSGGGSLNVGPLTGAGTGIVNINTTGSLFFSNTPPVVGMNQGYGAVTQTAGTVTMNPTPASSGGYLEIATNSGLNPTSYGSYTLAGGSLSVNNAAGIRVADGGVGVFTQTGGALTITRYFAMTSPGNGSNSGGESVATFSGGTFNTSTGYNIRVQDNSSGASMFNVGTLAGGTAQIFDVATGNGGGVEVTDGNSVSGGTGIVNINRGTLQLASAIYKGAAGTAGAGVVSVVNLNGGVIQAGASNVTLIDNGSISNGGTPNPLDGVYVFNGNAIFDTNGFNSNVSASMVAAQGNGIYTPTINLATAITLPGNSGSLGGGYIGAPFVTISGGSNSGITGTNASAIANVVNGQVTSVTLTSPGQGYQVGDQIQFSFLDGTGTGQSASLIYTLTAADLQANNGGLNKIGAGTLNLTGSNTYTGQTNVSAGALNIAVDSALPTANNVLVGLAATLILPDQNTESSIASLNLNGNMIVHNGSLATLNGSVAQGYNNGKWNGTGGIVSSAAAGDASALHALGVIQNDDGTGTGTALYTTFEGQAVGDTDVLVKYTYYGDANLDGKVDGTDYSRIDNGYLSHLTGWFNGDFNYDGVINGSDYTLIDNAYNTQGAGISAEVAAATAQVAAGAAGSAAVPEPATFGLAAFAAAGFLGRRRRRN